MSEPLTRKRRYIIGLACVAAMLAAGCSTVATTKTLKAADQALTTTGLRIVFVESQLKSKSDNPRSGEAYLQDNIASLSAAFREVLSDGLRAEGIETLSWTAPTDAEGRVTAETARWMASEKPDWPALFVVPTRAQLVCQPCAMWTTVLAQLNDGGRLHWSATFEQPTFIGSHQEGKSAAHRHFANEVLREIRAKVQAPGRPSGANQVSAPERRAN